MLRAASALALAILVLGAGASARVVNPGESAVIGEVILNFTNGSVGGAGDVSGCSAGTLVGPVDGASEGIAQNSLFLPFSGGMFNARDAGLVPGRYNLSCGTWNATPSQVNSTIFTFVRPFPDAAMRTTSAEAGYGGRGVSAAARSDKIVLNATTYLAPVAGCTLSFLVQDSSGVSRSTASNAAVSSAGAASTNLTVPVSWSTENYTALVKTNSTACNGLDAESKGVSFRVVDAEITLTASETVVTQDRPFYLRGTAQPFKLVQVANNPLRGGADSSVAYVSGSGFSELGTQLVGTDTTSGRSCSNVGGWGVTANLSTSASNISKGTACMRADQNGKFGVALTLTKKFIYEFNASLVGGSATRPTVVVKAESVSATVTTDKPNYTVGEKVRIQGTALGGEYITIALNSRVYFNDTLVRGDGTFTEEWDTSRELPGPRFVEVWVCGSSISKAAGGTSCWPATGAGGRGTQGLNIKEGITKTGPPPGTLVGPGASSSFTLVAGGLTASISLSKVAQDDKPDFSGSARGVAQIYYWVFNEKGTTAGGKCGTGSARVVKEDDYKFKQGIPANLVEDPGEVTVFLQTLGRDGVYADKGAGATNPFTYFDCSDDDATKPGLANQPGRQILALLKDAVGEPASDDYEFFQVLKFTVEPRRVTLNPCGRAIAGRDHTISGKSNRVDKANVSITLSNPNTTQTQVTLVSKGAFSATFPTSGLSPGNYTVTADYPAEGRTPDRPSPLGSASAVCQLAPGTPASLAVGNIQGPTKANAGKNVTLSVAVENKGDTASSSLNVSWLQGGEVLAGCAAARAVPGNGIEVFNCTTLFDEAGVYYVSAHVDDGKNTGIKTITLEVEAKKAPAPSAAPPSGPSLARVASDGNGISSKAPPPASPKPPGFEATLAAATLLVAVAAARRSRRNGP
ncbi:MAG: hypothetical protein HY558_05775 [Euryarchaeota archaeon]|nr:hypothetical protein [Euryarchaeota archaeon]